MVVKDLEKRVKGSFFCEIKKKSFSSEVRKGEEEGSLEVYCPYCKEDHTIPRRHGNYQ